MCQSWKENVIKVLRIKFSLNLKAELKYKNLTERNCFGDKTIFNVSTNIFQ